MPDGLMNEQKMCSISIEASSKQESKQIAKWEKYQTNDIQTNNWLNSQQTKKEQLKIKWTKSIHGNYELKKCILNIFMNEQAEEKGRNQQTNKQTNKQMNKHMNEWRNEGL